MNRREVLKRTAYLTGAALSAPLISAILSGCNVEETANATDYQPQFFQNEDFSRLTELVDLILPKTESPSASEVGVHHLIDRFVAEIYLPENQKAYQEGFSALKAHLTGVANPLATLKQLESPETRADAETVAAYRELKQQTLAFYLSTETIAKTYLSYLPVPGAYQACIDLADVDGKAWAL